MKRAVSKLVLIFVVLAMTIAVFTGCSSSSTSSSNVHVDSENSEKLEPAMSKTIVYGGSSWMGHIPAYIAVKKGFFEDEGLDVDFQSFSTSSARMTALAAGEIDFASTGAISAIALMAAGDDSFSVFGAPDIYVGQEGIIASADISAIEDLRGKTVAVPFSSSAHVMLLSLLADAGLDAHQDVNVVNMSGGDMASSFSNGEVDAAAIWNPQFSLLQEIDGAKVLATDTDTLMYKQYGFGAGPDLLVIREGFVNENPETAKKLMKGYFNAIKWMRENPREAAEIFVELSSLDIEEQEKIIESVTWLDETDQTEQLNENGNLTEILLFLADFLADNNLIHSKPDVREWINIGILPE